MCCNLILILFCSLNEDMSKEETGLEDHLSYKSKLLEMVFIDRIFLDVQQ